jgi:hypothetical protein
MAFAFICLAAATATAAADGQLPDGLYRCTISNMHLGDMEIAGSSFRGPAHDGKWKETYRFELAPNGVIDWGGPLGGISAAGTIVSSVLKSAGKGRVGYDITIRNARGNFQTVSCAPKL